MKRLNTPFPTVVFLLFLLFLSICLISNIDEALFLKLNHLSQVFPDNIWGFLMNLSNPIVASLLIFALFHRNQLFLRAFFLTLILALISNYTLKHGFGFERPSALLESEMFNMIGPMLTSPSFSSGHTLTLFSLVGLISSWYKNRSISFGVLLVATIISFASISVGAHWPSDVLLGALMGCLIGWLATEINTRLDQNITEGIALTGYFIALFAGIFSLITKTSYPSGQWLSTAVSMLAIAYALKSITELLHRQKG